MSIIIYFMRGKLLCTNIASYTAVQCHIITLNDLTVMFIMYIVASENMNTESLSELGKDLVLWRVISLCYDTTWWHVKLRELACCLESGCDGSACDDSSCHSGRIVRHRSCTGRVFPQCGCDNV